MVFIQAEARLKPLGKNGHNIGGAIIKLNKIRNSRGLGDYSGAHTVKAVLHAILQGRRREFIGEGQRFFDLKRLGMAIRKAPGTRSSIVQNVPYSDHRVLNNIPYNEVKLSKAAAARGVIPEDSVLVQNPGY